MFDGKAFGEAVVAQVKGHVERIVGGFESRLKAVEDRPVAKDGVGVAGAVIDRGGQLVLTLSDGKSVNLGVVVGRDAEPAKQGESGFSLDDFAAEMQPDGRTVQMKFARGDQVQTYDLMLPVMIYRGVFKEGQSYERGDTVTWGGSLWHCDEPTDEKPEGPGKAWTLAAKRGRDGKGA